MTKDILRRIEKLCSESETELQHVLKLIDSGTYFDELSEKDKDAYCRYRGFDRKAREQFITAYAAATEIDLAEADHEPLERNATPAEQQAMRENVERWMQEAAERYNSPEEVAKRKAKYEELQRIGELRRMDFYCGRNMDECHPLPWQ